MTTTWSQRHGTWWLNSALAKDHGYTCHYYIWCQLPDKAYAFAALAAHYAGLELVRREAANG